MVNKSRKGKRATALLIVAMGITCERFYFKSRKLHQSTIVGTFSSFFNRLTTFLIDTGIFFTSG